MTDAPRWAEHADAILAPCTTVPTLEYSVTLRIGDVSARFAYDCAGCVWRIVGEPPAGWPSFALHVEDLEQFTRKQVTQ